MQQSIDVIGLNVVKVSLQNGLRKERTGLTSFQNENAIKDTHGKSGEV